MTVWSLQDAKNKFSAVVSAALKGEPQRVTRHGKPAVVIVSAEEFDRLLHQDKAEAPSFAEFLLSIPGGDASLDRQAIRPRELED
jgi:antitoxin Phd